MTKILVVTAVVAAGLAWSRTVPVTHPDQLRDLAEPPAIAVQTPSGGSATDPRATAIPTPAGAGSGMYSMTSDAQGHVYLSWIESTGDKGHELQFSRLDGERWSPPRTIARGQNWFVNWADKPSVVAMPDGSLAAHWLVNNGSKKGAYGYGLRIAHSRDAGHTWREVFSAGTNNTKGYSGFVTFLPGTQGLLAAYLTPKGTSPADEEAHMMTLSQATFGPDSALQSQGVIDPDACSCCTTTVAQTARGPIIAYRDHQFGEIRDISIVRQINGRWTAPQTVHRDGWRINGCPTNGPVLAANGNRVAAAWFTAANDQPHVKVAFSGSAGEQFDAPTIVDSGRPVGWPAIVLLEDGAAVVSWLESTGGGGGEVRMRRVESDGGMHPPIVLTTAAGGRSTGIPQMVRTGDSLVFAWRAADRVLTARVPVPRN